MPSLSSLVQLFGEPISAYTRAQAIADGILIDVSDIAREAGFRVPVALTQAAWADCVAWSEEDSQRQVPQDEAGRLWDVMNLARFRIRRSAPDAADVLSYRLMRVPCDGKAKRPVSVDLRMHSGAGDTGEHVITIMLPHED